MTEGSLKQKYSLEKSAEGINIISVLSTVKNYCQNNPILKLNRVIFDFIYIYQNQKTLYKIPLFLKGMGTKISRYNQWSTIAIYREK